MRTDEVPCLLDMLAKVRSEWTSRAPEFEFVAAVELL